MLGFPSVAAVVVSRVRVLLEFGPLVQFEDTQNDLCKDQRWCRTLTEPLAYQIKNLPQPCATGAKVSPNRRVEDRVIVAGVSLRVLSWEIVLTRLHEHSGNPFAVG